MESLVLTGAVVVGALALGWLAGWWAERLRLKRAKASAEHEAARIREAAEQDAKRIRKSAELEGRRPPTSAKEEWEREEGRRREEIEEWSGGWRSGRTSLDRKFDLLDEKEAQLESGERELRGPAARRRAAGGGEFERLAKEARRRLEQLAGHVGGRGQAPADARDRGRGARRRRAT